VGRKVGARNEYRILVAKLAGKSPTGRLRIRSKDNIKVDLSEVLSRELKVNRNSP